MEPKDLRSSYNPNLPHFDMSSDEDDWPMDKSVDPGLSITSIPGKLLKSTVNKARSLLPIPKDPLVSSDAKAERAAKTFKKLNLEQRDPSAQLEEDLRKASATAQQILPNISEKTVKDLQGPFSNRDWFPCLAAFVNSMQISEDLKLKFLDFKSQMHKYLSGKDNNNIPKKDIRWLLLKHFKISEIQGDPKAVEAAVRDLLNPSKWVEGIYKHYGKEADQLVIGFILDFPELLGLGLDDEQRIQAAKDYAFLQNLSQSALPKEQKEQLRKELESHKGFLQTFSAEGNAFNLAVLDLSALAEAYRHPVAPKAPELPVDPIQAINKTVKQSDKSQTKSSVVSLFKNLDPSLKTDKFLALRTLFQARDVVNHDLFKAKLDVLKRQLVILLDDYIQDPEELQIAIEETMNFIFERSGFEQLDPDPDKNPLPAMLEFLNNDKAVFAAIFEGLSRKKDLRSHEFCNQEKFRDIDDKLDAILKDLSYSVEKRFALKFRLLDYLSRECDPIAFLNADNAAQTNILFHPILIVFKDTPPLQLIINLRKNWGTQERLYTTLSSKLDAFLVETSVQNKEAFKNYLFDQILGAALSKAKVSEKSPMTELSLLISKGDNIAEILYRPIIAEYIVNLPPSMPPLRALEGVRDLVVTFRSVFKPKNDPFYEDLHFLANLPFVAGNEPLIFGIINSLNQPDYATTISQLRKDLEGDFFTKIGAEAVAAAQEKLGVRSKVGYTGAFGMWITGEMDLPPRIDEPRPIGKRQITEWVSALKGDPLTDFICLVQVMNTSPDPATLSGYFNFAQLMKSIFEAMNLSVDEQRVFLANLVTPYFAKINSDALPAALCNITKSDFILMAMVESAFPDQQVSDERTLSFVAAIKAIAPTFPSESNLYKINEHLSRILGAFKNNADNEVVVSYLLDLISARVLASPNNPKKVFEAVLTALYYLDDLEPLLEFLRKSPDILKEADPLKKLNKAVDLMLAVARQEKSNEDYVALFEGLKIQINQVQGAANPNAKEVYWIRRRLLDCERSLFQGNGHEVLTDFTMAIGRVNLSLQVGNFINRTIANLIQGYVKTNEEKGLIAKIAGKKLIDSFQKWTVNSEHLPAALNLLREPLVDLIGRISTKDLLKTVLDEFSGDLVFGAQTALTSLNQLNKADRKKQIESFYNARATLSNILYQQFIQPTETNPVGLGNIPRKAMEDFLFQQDRRKTLMAELNLDNPTYWKFVMHIAQHWSNELEHYANAKPRTQEIIKEYWAKSLNPEHKNDVIVKNIANLLKKYVDGPVNQFIEAKLPVGKDYAINWINDVINATLNSTLDQILKSGHDGWLILGLLEPLIPAQVPLPVDNGGAPNRLNTYENPKLETVSGELAQPLLDVVSKRGGYGVSTVAKVANAIVPTSVISTNLAGSVFGPVFQGLESINIPQLVSQLSKGLSKPSFPSQVDQIAFDKKASDILGGLIALKREITTLERDKPAGWENTILGKKVALHTQNADLFKLLNESPYAADPEIFKVYQEEIVTNEQTQQFMHDALLALYNGKLGSLLGEDFVRRVTLFLPYTGVETLVGGLKRVLQEIGGGLPDYLTSPLFAKKFGEIVQKVVVISLMEQLEKSDEHIHIEEYKQ